MTLNVLIIGATSGIAEAVGRRYAGRGAKLFLVGRNASKLEAIAADLRVRGAAQVSTFVMDANDTARIATMLDAAWGALGEVHVALVAHGTLPDQAIASSNNEYLVREFRNNAESVITILAALGQRFVAQRSGVIAVIGSVAGDRGRASNYLYGAAKAAVHAFASGLRAQLFSSGVHVLTIKPGFVATAMTANLDLPAKLTATPDAVAARIESAINKRIDVVYTPGFWWLIMTLIRVLPETLFKRLKF